MTNSPEFRSSLRPAPSVHARLFDGELVILDLARGEYFALDPIGSQLWTGLEAGRTVEQIAEALIAEYDASLEAVIADLRQLARELQQRGLLIPGDQ